MKIIICPNDEKMNILENNSNNNELSNIKFMSKQEYMNHYYYEYDEKAIYYLMKKYNLNIDVAKVYLNNMIYIDIDKKYNNKKLNYLQELKEECLNNNLFYFHETFINYLKDKEIEVKNIYNLEKYEEKALSYKEEYNDITINNKVYKFDFLEQEINFVCQEIIKLINKGININNIYLTNVSEDYYYMIWKLFNYYNIPISIPFKDSIYSSPIVQKYLNNNVLEEDDNETTKLLYRVINSLVDLPQDDIYRSILIDKLKHTYYKNKELDNSVRIKDLKNNIFKENDYVFLIGFNQDSIPSTKKDIDYLSDEEKKEVDLYTTVELNKKERQIIPNILSNINNLTISYKLHSPFQDYYPSSLIKDYNLEEIVINEDEYNLSNIYNKIRLGEMLDKFHVYGEKHPYLETLYSNYPNTYDTYDNKFSGINRDLYLENLKVPLRLSYTSLNSYVECGFKYYLNYVLKIGEYTDTFAAFIGSMYHHILTLYKNHNFDLDVEFKNYLEKRDLNLKETILLIKIKEDLIKLIDVLKQQQLITGYNEELYEKYISIPLRTDISVELIGYIDKIMFYKKIDDTYFSILDYKTGTIDTNIEPLKYGLHMQLPIYLYFINYGKVFESPIFTGIYYQNILFDYPTYSKNYLEDDKKKYYYQGYSTNNIDILERFDSTYQNSELIRSMKYSDEKGFDRHTKIMDDDTLYNLVEYTKNMINQKTDDILNAKFTINPKIYKKNNVSCSYCDFKDICFKTEKDIERLDDVEDLSFLGGDL